MSDEKIYAVEKLETAFRQFKEGCDHVRDELTRDGAIQRFEFTFELLWKTIKIFLRDQGVEARSPKDCLKEAFRLGWIVDEETFAQMLEDRNSTSHIYSQEKAEEIFLRIKTRYVTAIDKLAVTLKKMP
jgi:nucleotidyltransferase substrate binding protein (TIGR01987 family)